MITFVVKHPHDYTLRPFMRAYKRFCRQTVKTITYERLLAGTRVRPGVYVFCDIERLLPLQAEAAARLRKAVADAWGGQFVFNHPTVSWTRCELLQRLHAAGINQHTAVWADGPLDGLRYPVFIRREDEHTGSESTLIGSYAELSATLDRMRARGLSLRNRMVVEHCDMRDEQGLYNLRAVHRFGDRIYAGHMYVSEAWEVKERNRLTTDAWMRREASFLRENPDARRIMEICDRAGIEYGRVDYSRAGDRLEVWEINTNPTHMSHQIPRCDTEVRNVALECEMFREILAEVHRRWTSIHPRRMPAIRWRPPDVPWYSSRAAWRRKFKIQWNAWLRAIRRGMDRVGLARITLRRS